MKSFLINLSNRKPNICNTILDKYIVGWSISYHKFFIMLYAKLTIDLSNEIDKNKLLYPVYKLKFHQIFYDKSNENFQNNSNKKYELIRINYQLIFYRTNNRYFDISRI